jgi:CDGSH-type Zn-finger protein/uncharacterized Fe-S cluster protein YjdI
VDEDIHEYIGENVRVTFDAKRCIHARECVRGLPAVFDPQRRPWVDPDRADVDDLAAVIERCPTGALHYERTDDGPAESVPATNAVEVSTDGPLYLRGDVEVRTPGGDVVLEDTRVALCRCGQSANKPLCDGTHRDAGFEAAGTVSDPDSASGTDDAGGRLRVTPTRDGPLELAGAYELRGDADDSSVSETGGWLCRCGGSENKPFCDGTHSAIGFTTDDV